VSQSLAISYDAYRYLIRTSYLRQKDVISSCLRTI
jgi:hypothetical protein